MTKYINSLILLMTALIYLPGFAGTFEGGGGPSSSIRAVFKSLTTKNEISNRRLNVVLRNRLHKAQVGRHPSVKIKLFDACIKGEYIESISKAPKTHCIHWLEESSEINGQAVQKLTCREWSSSLSYKNALRYAEANPKDCKLIPSEIHPNPNLYGSRPNQKLPYCNYKTKLSMVPEVRTIEVYSMRGFTSTPIYFRANDSDNAQPGSSRYKYTIPQCK